MFDEKTYVHVVETAKFLGIKYNFVFEDLN